jgi:hypothetical protein
MGLLDIFEGGEEIFSSVLGFIGQERANSANSNEARYNRDFQERMTRNRHQYQVEDLRQAGLNPILSATNGAPVPSGATAHTQVNSAKAAIDAFNQTKLTKAQTGNLKQQEATGKQLENSATQDVWKKLSETVLNNEKQETERIVQEHIKAQIKHVRALESQASATARGVDLDNFLKNLEVQLIKDIEQFGAARALGSSNKDLISIISKSIGQFMKKGK